MDKLLNKICYKLWLTFCNNGDNCVIWRWQRW